MSSCNGSYQADPLEPVICDEHQWNIILEAVFLIIVIICSFCANLFVLFLVMKYRSLRYMSMMVSVCGVFADILMTIIFHVPALVSVLNGGEWAFGYIGCQVIGVLCYYLVSVRWMIMAVIALDRFSYILFPLSYNSWSKPYIIILIISAWCVPVFMNIPSIVQVGTYTYRTGLSQCALDCDQDSVCKLIHFVVFTIMYSIGVLVPTCLYTAIAIIARRKRQNIRMGFNQSDEGETGTTTTTHDNRWNAAGTKDILVFVLIFVSFIVTNTPLYIMILIRRSAPSVYMAIPLWGHMLIANFFYLSNIVNPLLIMKNKDFTTAAFKLCCKRKPRAYRTSSLSTLRRASIPQNTIIDIPHPQH